LEGLTVAHSLWHVQSCPGDGVELGESPDGVQCWGGRTAMGLPRKVTLLTFTALNGKEITRKIAGM
jgi:hypothetical protein